MPVQPSMPLIVTVRRFWWWFRWRFLALATAFMCGFLAFRMGAGVSSHALPDDPGSFQTLLTHLYYTLGLFVLGGMDLGMPDKGPAQAQAMLWVAFFLCPAITASAVAEGLVRAINPQWWALRRIRDHVVIGGGGRLSRLFLSRLKEVAPHVPVVIVENQADVLGAEDAREQYGAWLVNGDISSPAVLRGLGLGKARALVLLTGNDFTNMEAASKVLSSHPGMRGRVVLHVSDITMLRLLERSQVLRDAERFNSHRIAASHLVVTRLLEHFERTAPRDLVVLAGFGRFGQTILHQLQLHAPGAFEKVVIIDAQARLNAAVFDEQVGFDDCYQRVVIEGDMANPTVWDEARELFDGQEHEPVFVLGSSNDGENLRVAMWISHKFPNAYTVALSFRQSAFAEQISHVCHFDVVSAEDLVRRSMPDRWFNRPRRRLLGSAALLGDLDGDDALSPDPSEAGSPD